MSCLKHGVNLSWCSKEIPFKRRAWRLAGNLAASRRGTTTLKQSLLLTSARLLGKGRWLHAPLSILRLVGKLSTKTEYGRHLYVATSPYKDLEGWKWRWPEQYPVVEGDVCCSNKVLHTDLLCCVVSSPWTAKNPHSHLLSLQFSAVHFIFPVKNKSDRFFLKSLLKIIQILGQLHQVVQGKALPYFRVRNRKEEGRGGSVD